MVNRIGGGSCSEILVAFMRRAFGRQATKVGGKKLREFRAIRNHRLVMKHEAITKDIIGAAIAVLNELKPGLDEKLYENALVLELVARGHTVEQQREYPVHYRGQFIGRLVPDLIVAGKVIADPKVVTAFNETHVAQMLGYLNITNLEVALLLNFKEARLTWKRVVRGEPEAVRSQPSPAEPQ